MCPRSLVTRQVLFLRGPGQRGEGGLVSVSPLLTKAVTPLALDEASPGIKFDPHENSPLYFSTLFQKWVMRIRELISKQVPF